MKLEGFRESEYAMLDKLTCEQFAQYLGETFQLQFSSQTSQEITSVALKLLEAMPYKTNLGELESMRSQRTPFSLTFQGPLATVLTQKIYTLEHTEMGKLDIFLVPVARRQDGMLYEAIFT
jgi:hypothetical protein